MQGGAGEGKITLLSAAAFLAGESGCLQDKEQFPGAAGTFRFAVFCRYVPAVSVPFSGDSQAGTTVGGRTQ